MWNTINPENVSFGPIVKTKTGRKLINIFHDKKTLRFQSPAQVAPGGAKEFQNKTTGVLESIVLNGTFGKGEDADMNKYMEIIEALENKVLETASERSKEWFGDEFTVAELKKAKMFKSQIRRDPEGKYPPSLQMKLQYYDGKCTTKCYDMNRNAVNYEYITKGSKVVSILEVGSIWLIDGKFGITFKVMQCKAQKNERTIDEYAFIDEVRRHTTIIKRGVRITVGNGSVLIISRIR
jgi:hypothetical protein